MEGINNILNNLGQYANKYTPEKLFDKIGGVAKKAGVKTVYAALLLYYATLDKQVPLKDKAIVLGALGYFILPFDLIPDLMGPLGFTDDLTALMLALNTIRGNLTDETFAKAKDKVRTWFDEVSEEDLTLF